MENNKRTIQDYFSLGYLYLILCGLAKDIIFYGFLDVNILDYSSISDVLLSPIIYLGNNLPAIGFVVILLIVMFTTHNKVAKWHNKYKEKKWYNMGMDMSGLDEYYASPPTIERALPLLATTLFCFFLGTGIGGGYAVKDKLATLDYEANRKIHFQDKESVDVKFIGQNSQYVFYVFPKDPIIHISPIQGNIKHIELLPEE